MASARRGLFFNDCQAEKRSGETTVADSPDPNFRADSAQPALDSLLDATILANLDGAIT
jgi:hypothetical protein